MYYNGYSYQKISNLFNEEKVLGKDNWRDSTIVGIIENELFDKGYIDTTKPAIFGNVLGNVRFSNYLSKEEFGEIIMRLRQYYDVGYTEATYYLDK